MAIQDGDNNAQQSTQTQAQAQDQAQDTGYNAGRTWSFNQQNLLGNPIAGGSGGEYLTSFRKSLEEVYKEIAPGLEIKLISLNRQSLSALKFSALVVALRSKDEAPNVVSYYTFVLEATGEKLKTEFRTIDGQNTPVRRVTGEANDEVMQQISFGAVSNEYKGCVVLPADGTVIYADKRPQDDKAMLESYARNAASACYSAIMIHEGSFGELDLTRMDRDARFTIDMTFGNHKVKDIDNSPIRANTVLVFSSQKKTANGQRQQAYGAVNVPETSARISALSGFLHPLWAPLQPQASGAWGALNGRAETQAMAAEFVATSIRSDFAISPSAILLAMMSSMSLIDNDNWLQGFIPRTSGGIGAGQVDITDIGALNIMANITRDGSNNGFGKPISLETMGSDYAKISTYLVSVFRPGLIVSLDCPEFGPESWIFAPFAAAAAGDPDAQRLLWDAAMELTGGQFDKHFKFGTPMFTNIMRVPGGYYPVGDHLEDIRQIDLTAISNLNDKNPRIIQEFAATFADQTGMSPERALAVREGIIMDSTNQQAVIDRYFARVTFSSDFLGAISEALNSIALPITVNTPLTADLMRTGAPTPSFVQGSVTSGTRTFRAGGYQGSRTPGASYRGRFGR